MKPKQGDSGSVTCMNQEKMHVRTMGDCISRQEAIDAIDRERKKKHLFNTAEDGLLEARGVINTLPSAQLERKKGHWINEGAFARYHGGNVYRCSRCGNRIVENEPDDFCKYCGSYNREGGTE